ncbi:MAG: hypothetical protein J5903_03225 [Clostridia bacterium]|nr:hypothetical protein [Clostridia bacterium]
MKDVKERCLDIMERAIGCYSPERLEEYFSRVEKEGLTEHGFPRITANIGILNARGRRLDLFKCFVRGMDICCDQIPKVKAANEFSVRELCFAIKEAEKAKLVQKERIDEWKTRLGSRGPLDLYDCLYTQAPDLHNWAFFGAVSEWTRYIFGMNGDRDFVDRQLATQISHFDGNGMYRDIPPMNPMLYDYVPRMLAAILLEYGYDGKYAAILDGFLEKSGKISMKLQSVTGELPFGGRSNQFLLNEATMISVFLYEAKRYSERGNAELSGRFVGAADLAVRSIEYWLAAAPDRHVKNLFSQDSFFGCEDYAYFDKYMITLASNIYPALLIDVDAKIRPCLAEVGGFIVETSEHFHKTAINEGGYYLEFDTFADTHYDASGLGRVHKAGAPSTICLSVPFPPGMPEYRIDKENPCAFSICPAVKNEKGEWLFASDRKTVYALTEKSSKDGSSELTFECGFCDGTKAAFKCSVSSDGVILRAEATGKEVGICFPAFLFDGENHTEIVRTDNNISIKYRGCVCEYTAKDIFDLGTTFSNRNGIYAGYLAKGDTAVELRITIIC